jgi:hypothetical protein
MKYADALYRGLCGEKPSAVLVTRIKAELLVISTEISRMLPNRLLLCWHDRTLVVHNAMGRTLGLARMEIAPGDTGFPVCVAWSDEKLFAHTINGLCDVLSLLLANTTTARVIAFTAAVPGMSLTAQELDLAEKSVEHPELFKYGESDG